MYVGSLDPAARCGKPCVWPQYGDAGGEREVRVLVCWLSVSACLQLNYGPARPDVRPPPCSRRLTHSHHLFTFHRYVHIPHRAHGRHQKPAPRVREASSNRRSIICQRRRTNACERPGGRSFASCIVLRLSRPLAVGYGTGHASRPCSVRLTARTRCPDKHMEWPRREGEAEPNQKETGESIERGP